MNRIDRRDFLRTGIGAAGAVALSPVSKFGIESRQDRNIITRTLGRTGMKVPVISFGVMRSDNPGLVKAAYENGITLFDTAHGYQNGNNEVMLGNFFKDVPRNSFFIETKVKPSGVGRDGKPTDETTAEDFLSRFEMSLSRLKLDYVDVLYVHDISNPELMEYKPLLSAVQKLKKQKKIRFVGFSTHANMAAVINAAATSENWDVILTSYNFKMSNIDEMNSAISGAAKAGIGIVAMKTLAGGGFLDKEKTKPINTAAALKWALSNPDVHTTIPGMTTFDHLDSNLKLLSDITLTDEEKKDLLIASAETGMICTACSNCLKSCQFNLPVPDLMRAYMYAYGYSDVSQAYDLLGNLGTGSSPCSNCDSCRVDCRGNFNIRERISDISRLVNVPSDFIV